MAWDLCRHTQARETVIFMFTEDQVEPIFLWSGGDYYMGPANLENLTRVMIEYLHH